MLKRELNLMFFDLGTGLKHVSLGKEGAMRVLESGMLDEYQGQVGDGMGLGYDFATFGDHRHTFKEIGVALIPVDVSKIGRDM